MQVVATESLGIGLMQKICSKDFTQNERISRSRMTMHTKEDEPFGKGRIEREREKKVETE